MQKLLITFSAVFLLLLPFFLHAQQRITLQEALDKNLIQVKVRGNGGYSGQAIQMAVKNVSSHIISLEVLPGQIFSSDDSTVQDLITTAPAMLAIGPNAVKTTSIFAMCTQSSNMSPSKHEPFTLGPMAESHLLKLAQKIAKHDYQSSTAQSAIWAVANRDPIRNIYGSDTALVREIATVVSEATGVPMSEFNFTPREHHITDIRTSMEILADQHYDHAKLVLVDKNDVVIRHYFSDRKIEPGFMQYRVGASHTLGDSAELYLRLMNGDDIIQEKRVFPSDTIPPVEQIHTKSVMTFLVKEPGYGSVGIYDENDQLYFYIREKKMLSPGFNRGTYIAGKHLPAGKEYYIKVKQGEETLAEERVNSNGNEPIIYPKREIKGVFQFTQKTVVKNARLAVYDSEGKVKRMLAEVHVINPGPKRYAYSFEHVDGPGAKFYIRLTDAEGNVLHEKIVP